MQSDQEIPLTGAQRGLVFSATSEGNIVHWLGVRPFNDPSVSSRLVGMMSRLPFQVGTPLPIIEDEGSTEILSSASTAESGTNSTVCYSAMPTAEKSLCSDNHRKLQTMSIWEMKICRTSQLTLSAHPMNQISRGLLERKRINISKHYYGKHL